MTPRIITSSPAIVTRYLGPTDHRGSRIAAWLEDGAGTLHRNDSGQPFRIIRSYDYAASDPHDVVALELFELARADGYWRGQEPKTLNKTSTTDGARYIVARERE